MSSFSKQIWAVSPLPWSFERFQWSPVFGSQLRLIPSFVLLKIKWSPHPFQKNPPPGDKEWRACTNQWDYILASKHGIAKKGRFLVRGYTEGDSSTISLAIAFWQKPSSPRIGTDLRMGKLHLLAFAPLPWFILVDLLAWSCGVGVGGEYIKKII